MIGTGSGHPLRAMLGHPALRDHLVGADGRRRRANGITVTRGRRLNGKELLHLLDWLTAVSSVELKMLVPVNRRMAISGLDLDIIEGRLREVYFFDTPDLMLFRKGVVLRARRTQGADDDAVVVVRPAVPATLSRAVQASRNLKLEMDVTPGAYMVSASLAGRSPVGAVRGTVTGGRALERLFTGEQRAFFAEHAPVGVDWHALVPLGPVVVVLLAPVTGGFGRSTIEQWHYPTETPLVEVSTVVTPENSFRVLADDVKFMRRNWVTGSGARERSTLRTLELFARHLPGAQEGRREAT